MLVAVVGRGRRAARATPTARSSPAASTTRASRCSPGTPRAATPLTPIVTWQDKRSQEVLDRLEPSGRAERMRERSGMPLDPYFSRRQARLAPASTTRTVAARRRGRHAAAGHGRLVASATGSAPASPPTPRPRRAPSSPSRAAGLGPRAARGVRRAARGAARDHRQRRRARHAAPPGLAGRAAAARARRRPAGGARGCRLRRARAASRRPTAPGVFVLAHVGDERPAGAAEAGLLPTVAWRIDGRVEYALDGGVFTAGALLEWLSRDLGLAADPPALAALAAEVEDARRRARAAGAGRARRAVVALRGARRDRRADARARGRGTSRARRSRRSPGAWPTCCRAVGGQRSGRRCCGWTAA